MKPRITHVTYIPKPKALTIEIRIVVGDPESPRSKTFRIFEPLPRLGHDTPPSEVMKIKKEALGRLIARARGFMEKNMDGLEGWDKLEDLLKRLEMIA